MRYCGVVPLPGGWEVLESTLSEVWWGLQSLGAGHERLQKVGRRQDDRKAEKRGRGTSEAILTDQWI